MIVLDRGPCIRPHARFPIFKNFPSFVNVTTMSRLSAYIEWIKAVLESHRGDRSRNVDPLNLREGPIELPIYRSEEIEKVRDFYQKQLEVAERFALAPTRKDCHDKLCKSTIKAYMALYRKQRCQEGVECLVTSLKYINTALECATQVRDYDDQHLIGHSEWGTSEFGLVANDEDARKAWFHFKLASIRPCLLLAAQVLKLTLAPTYREVFDESEKSLRSINWHSHFIYDSQISRKRMMLVPHPTMSDVLKKRKLNGSGS